MTQLSACHLSIPNSESKVNNHKVARFQRWLKDLVPEHLGGGGDGNIGTQNTVFTLIYKTTQYSNSIRRRTHLGQLRMCQGKCPKSQVRRCVGDGSQNTLNGVDGLVSHALRGGGGIRN